MKNLKNLLIPLFSIILLSVFLWGFNQKKENDFLSRPMDVGIVVSDLQKSLDFYTKVIGMTEVGPWHVTPEISKSAGFTDGKAVDIINLKLNDEPGAPQYKLAKIQGVESETLPHSFRPGLRYLTIRVEDIEPYLKRIKEHNTKLWGDSPLDFPEYDYSVLILQDPDGAMLEIAGPLRK